MNQNNDYYMTITNYYIILYSCCILKEVLNDMLWAPNLRYFWLRGLRKEGAASEPQMDRQIEEHDAPENNVVFSVMGPSLLIGKVGGT